MFRHQFHVQVQLGKFRDFYETHQQLDAVIRAKKLAPSQLWALSFGNTNSVVLVTDHENLDAYYTTTRAFYGDPDCMKLWRELSQLAEGIPWDELWETAYEIA
jgi:hypothetical protein